MIDTVVLESRVALGRIVDLDSFSLASFVSYDQTMPPLVVALVLGSILNFFDVTWFEQRHTLYWSVCGAYFAAIVAVEAQQRRIKSDVYTIYLSQFSDEELQRVADCPWTQAGISFETKLAIGKLLNARRRSGAGG